MTMQNEQLTIYASCWVLQEQQVLDLEIRFVSEPRPM